MEFHGNISRETPFTSVTNDQHHQPQGFDLPVKVSKRSAFAKAVPNRV